MSGSSTLFERNPPTEPEWSADSGDPYARMDAAADTDPQKKQKLVEEIDWLAQEHRDLVKHHGEPEWSSDNGDPYARMDAAADTDPQKKLIGWPRNIEIL